MDKNIMILEMVDNLINLPEKKYQEAKEYWKDNPPKGENLVGFVEELFLYTDSKRKAGASNGII